MTETLESKKIVCKICKEEFEFCEGEQVYFAENGLAEPKKCLNCRRLEKLVKAEVARQLGKENK